MDLNNVRDEARKDASLYKTAEYFIRHVKGMNCIVTAIQEYDYDYKIYFDIATDEELEDLKNLKPIKFRETSTYHIIDKRLLKSSCLNRKLKKIKAYR